MLSLWAQIGPETTVTWKPLESHENDLVTFPHTCMLAVPELVGRLGVFFSSREVR